MSSDGAPAPVLSFTPALEDQLRRWLDEDIGRGDLTAPALVGRTGRAHWITRADGVFCGGVLVGPLLALLGLTVLRSILITSRKSKSQTLS
jgi:nicotinate-nucleotide pyrophosphorylase (carboxylating)